MPKGGQNTRENDNHARKVVALDSLHKGLDQAVDPEFSGEVIVSVVAQRGRLMAIKATVAQWR